ncbi:MAG: hypothetical protein ACKV2Q_23300 [Planctomycetaceae bacterium]
MSRLLYDFFTASERKNEILTSNWQRQINEKREADSLNQPMNGRA